MGERFYLAQLRETGQTVGFINKRRGKKMSWDDIKREKAVEMYVSAQPTSENSMEIVKQVADDLEETANGVRMILTKAGVYITKSTTSTKEPKEGAKTSKAAAFQQLNEAIISAGMVPNSEIIEKLTGKAALYFAEVISKVKAG
jgi:hypothetical protein